LQFCRLKPYKHDLLEKGFLTRQRGAGFVKTGVKTLIVGLAVMGFANGAPAQNAALTINDGVDPRITVTDNGPSDLNPGLGQLLVLTNVGVWNLTITSAVTKPALGSSTNPVMDIQIQADSSAPGTLEYTFSENGFGPVTGTLTATVSGHVISGASATAGYRVYGDPDNIVGAETVFLAGTATSPLPAVANNSGPLSLPTPFSLAQDVTLNAPGATDISLDVSFDVIPEPSTIGLVAIGLGFLPLLRRHRR
jgi:hypothetical protein